MRAAPVETHVLIGPTTKTVDVAGWLHIVCDIKNNGKSAVTIESQIFCRVMNANNRTIGIEYATPLSTTIQSGHLLSCKASGFLLPVELVLAEDF
jgi:hypothetical protein